MLYCFSACILYRDVNTMTDTERLSGKNMANIRVLNINKEQNLRTIKGNTIKAFVGGIGIAFYKRFARKGL